MAKPAQDAKWATSGSALIVDPGVGKRDTGWIVEIPPVEFFNWWMNNVGNWIEYLDLTVDTLVNTALIYDAYVGVGGTHGDINALMADPGIATLKNIVVITDLNVAVPQVINQNDMTFHFKAQAGVSKAAGISGIQITGSRVKLLNGKISGFNGGGDKALEISGDNCLVTGFSFDDNDTDIDDTGTNNVLGLNVSY